MSEIDNNSESKCTTCFGAQGKYSVCCQRKSCRHWINFSEGKNCTLIAAQSGPRTLQEIGEIYDLTRMRICQIEKGIYKKINEKMTQESYSD